MATGWRLSRARDCPLQPKGVRLWQKEAIPFSWSGNLADVMISTMQQYRIYSGYWLVTIVIVVNELQHFFASIEKAKSVLGWKPEFDLVEGLTDSYNLDFGRGTFRKAADFSTDDIILGKSLVLQAWGILLFHFFVAISTCFQPDLQGLIDRSRVEKSS